MLLIKLIKNKSIEIKADFYQKKIYGKQNLNRGYFYQFTGYSTKSFGISKKFHIVFQLQSHIHIRYKQFNKKQLQYSHV